MPTPLEQLLGANLGVTFLQLCEISYSLPASIPNLVSQIPAPSGGRWSCEWLSATATTDPNLAYLALFTDAATPESAVPVVVLRGTDFDGQDVWSIVTQAFEDLNITVQTTPSWVANPEAKVADGTLNALAAIQNLMDPNGRTLFEVLVKPGLTWPGIIVTGHSLGGCLTTVVAPWLKGVSGTLGGTYPVIPITYAAPTAGNAAYAEYLNAVCPVSYRFVNSLDVVPRAWADLPVLKTLMGPCSIPATEVVDFGADVFLYLMGLFQVSYAQTVPAPVLLPGVCEPAATASDWYSEALFQHHLTTYLNLLGGASMTRERLVPLLPRRTPRRVEAPPRRLDRLVLKPPHPVGADPIPASDG